MKSVRSQQRNTFLSIATDLLLDAGAWQKKSSKMTYARKLDWASFLVALLLWQHVGCLASPATLVLPHLAGLSFGASGGGVQITIGKQWFSHSIELAVADPFLRGGVFLVERPHQVGKLRVCAHHISHVVLGRLRVCAHHISYVVLGKEDLCSQHLPRCAWQGGFVLTTSPTLCLAS
mgnify:CR=1 FL=1